MNENWSFYIWHRFGIKHLRFEVPPSTGYVLNVFPFSRIESVTGDISDNSNLAPDHILCGVRNFFLCWKHAPIYTVVRGSGFELQTELHMQFSYFWHPNPSFAIIPYSPGTLSRDFQSLKHCHSTFIITVFQKICLLYYEARLKATVCYISHVVRNVSGKDTVQHNSCVCYGVKQVYTNVMKAQSQSHGYNCR